MSEATFYERAGGAATFKELTLRFYERVAINPILKPMYPDEDMAGAQERLPSVHTMQCRKRSADH